MHFGNFSLRHLFIFSKFWNAWYRNLQPIKHEVNLWNKIEIGIAVYAQQWFIISKNKFVIKIVLKRMSRFKNVVSTKTAFYNLSIKLYQCIVCRYKMFALGYRALGQAHPFENNFRYVCWQKMSTLLMILLKIRSKSVVRVKLYFWRNYKEGCYVGVVLYPDINMYFYFISFAYCLNTLNWISG